MGTTYHLIAGLKTREGHFGNGILFMSGFVGGEERRVGSQGEMNAGETNGMLSSAKYL